jgi:NEDD8-activating enzyme E1 regulatory subunit
LKNLVLPGVGRFTIIDPNVVTEADLGNNFFVDPTRLGRPRAAAVAELLCEMNPDVAGDARVASVADLIDKEPEYFRQFTLVLASQVPDADLRRLEPVLRSFAVPLVVRFVDWFAVDRDVYCF